MAWLHKAKTPETRRDRRIIDLSGLIAEARKAEAEAWDAGDMAASQRWRLTAEGLAETRDRVARGGE